MQATLGKVNHYDNKITSFGRLSIVHQSLDRCDNQQSISKQRGVTIRKDLTPASHILYCYVS